MQTIKLTLQYDGTAYAGWQVQNNAMTIQQALEKALATILQEEIRVAGASRTDSGVHALGQVASFKTSKAPELDRLVKSLNGILPRDIRVAEIIEVPADFVPRYAREKTYRYALACGKFISPFNNRYAWHLRETPDFEAMKEASSFLLGEHDFSSFTAAGGGEKLHVRNISHIDFGPGGIVDICDVEMSRGSAGVYHVDFTANGFLYKMIRNIMGTLVEVGLGKVVPTEMQEILDARDRTRAGPTAPAQGLCLVSIRY